jgi:hypothetical protein
VCAGDEGTEQQSCGGAHLNAALPRWRVGKQRRHPPLLFCCSRPFAARLSWLLPLTLRVPLLLLAVLFFRATRGRAGSLQ